MRGLSVEEITERETDPSALTRFAYAHPWRLGFGSGAIIATWSLVLGLVWPLALAVGAALAVGEALAWRRGGPAQRLRRYVLGRFPKKERM